jgi:hypothetical protein
MSDGQAKGPPAWVWIVVAMGGVIVLLSVLLPLAMYGVRKYMANAKRGEATAALVRWGDGLARCGESDKLPPSSSPVPASLSAVAGMKYQSASTDWSEPAHTCAGFSLSEPQYFQYSWDLTSPSSGKLRASADLNGDGAVDTSLDLQVLCEAGKCRREAPLDASGNAVEMGNSDAASTTSAGSVKSAENPVLGVLGGVWIGLCLLVSFGASIGMAVVAFRQSVGWGFLVLLVPCGNIAFLTQHWERAKRPFFWQLGSWGALAAGTLLLVLVTAASEGNAEAERERPAGTSLPPTPPVVSAVPIPALDGSAVDLSTVMGRARKLANAWQVEASLLGVEANLVGGKIPTQDGGSAKISFGPGPFASEQSRSGLFVVTYDKSGISGAPAKGTPGKPLAEPMCAPEGILPRLEELKDSPITLRYGLDGSQRPAWLVSLPGQAKPLRAFAPDDCSPRGTFIARPTR